MKIALDTDVLADAEGVNGAAMRDRALGLIQRLRAAAIVAAAGTGAGSRVELARRVLRG